MLCPRVPLVHFYHLHALDWVSPVEALKADPVQTAVLQNQLLEKYGAIAEVMPDFLAHRAYPKKFPNMLDVQRELFIPQVVFGGKNPHPHYLVGGMTCSISMNDMNAPINTERLAVVEDAIYTQIEAVNLFYLIDLLAIGHICVQKGQVYGGGLAKKRVIGYGEFPDEPYKGIKTGEYHNLVSRSPSMTPILSSLPTSSMVFSRRLVFPAPGELMRFMQ
jgi:hydrogenase large subunit